MPTYNITLEANKTMFESDGDNIWPSGIKIGTSSALWRSVIRADTTVIPTTEVVQTATLRMTTGAVIGDDNDFPSFFYVRRCEPNGLVPIQEWVNDETNWQYWDRTSGFSWTTPGGDFTTPFDVLSTPKELASNIDFNVLNTVANAVDQGIKWDVVVLFDVVEEAALPAETRVSFFSKDNATWAPVLIIETQTVTSTGPIFGSSIIQKA